MAKRIDAVIASLPAKWAVNHVTLSPASWQAFWAELGAPALLQRTRAYLYRGRPVVEGPHYHGPGVLWAKYGDVLHPRVIA